MLTSIRFYQILASSISISCLFKTPSDILIIQISVSAISIIFNPHFHPFPIRQVLLGRNLRSCHPVEGEGRLDPMVADGVPDVFFPLVFFTNS